MGNERLKARLRLEEPKVTHLRVAGTHNAYCGRKNAWDSFISPGSSVQPTCKACRRFTRAQDASGRTTTGWRE